MAIVVEDGYIQPGPFRQQTEILLSVDCEIGKLEDETIRRGLDRMGHEGNSPCRLAELHGDAGNASDVSVREFGLIEKDFVSIGSVPKANSPRGAQPRM